MVDPDEPCPKGLRLEPHDWTNPFADLIGKIRECRICGLKVPIVPEIVVEGITDPSLYNDEVR